MAIDKAPADKMMRKEDAQLTAVELAENEYFFPEYGASATGKSADEALAKIKASRHNKDI